LVVEGRGVGELLVGKDGVMPALEVVVDEAEEEDGGGGGGGRGM